MTQDQVFVVGAGPTGLVLALWLAKLGMRARIIDKNSGPGTASRAVVVQARTLELYRQANLAEAVIEQGHEIDGLNLWVAGSKRAHLPLHAIGEGLTPYPFVHAFPQDAHERLLIARLREEAIEVEWNTELLDFTDNGECVRGRLRKPDGNEEPFEAAYLAGCDGAHSLVRHAVVENFPGGTYRQLFYVADIEGQGEAFDGDIHIDLDQADFLGVFGLSDNGRARLIGTVRDKRADQADTLRFDDVSHHALQNLKLDIHQVNWFSTYHVHHRVAPRFRKGRAFIAGDAAHIHSPAGGQGMNTGIGDAINLAWKLTSVLRGQTPDSLLDSYDIERRAFAEKLVGTTDKVFTFATTEGRLADIVRTRIAPIVIPLVADISGAKEYLFRTVSQIMLNYRHSDISHGKAGHVHGGDRLPWVSHEGADNYASLREMAWQVHVYGEASNALIQWCDAHQIRLQVFEWHEHCGESGLARNALYLLRPDTYVALADETSSTEALDRYFSQHGIVLGRKSV